MAPVAAARWSQMAKQLVVEAEWLLRPLRMVLLVLLVYSALVIACNLLNIFALYTQAHIV